MAPGPVKKRVLFCLSPKVHPTPPQSRGTLVTSGGNPTGLALIHLEGQAWYYMNNGIAANTQTTNNNYVQQLFLEFCTCLNWVALPASDATIIIYATELVQTHTQTTIKLYLSELHHSHIIQIFLIHWKTFAVLS